jgi:serine/threonine-protein kinase
MTETGLSLGTPHYMSPEQATAEKELSARSDIYSLGCVLYEMLTGSPPHVGASAQQIVMKIVTEDAAPVTKLRKSVPPNVAAALAKALEKLPADRFDSAKGFADALGNPGYVDAAGAATGVNPGAAGANSRKLKRLTVVMSVLAAVLLGAALWGWLRPAPAAPVTATYVKFAPNESPIEGTLVGGLAPDGSALVYLGPGDGGAQRIWIKQRSELHAVPLAGTEGAVSPFFSPDGRWVAFFADGKLKKISARGGGAVTLADAATPYKWGGWLDNGHIVYAGPGFTLQMMSDGGGTPETVVTTDSFPGRGAVGVVPLPGSRGFLFAACGPNCSTSDLWVQDFRTRTPKRLVQNAQNGLYVESGHLLYTTGNGAWLAAPFDLKSLSLRGPGVPVLEGPGRFGFVDVSRDGTLFYQEGQAASGGVPMWVARNGRATPIDSSWRADVNSLALSPDGRRLAVAITAGREQNIWIKELDRGPLSKLTFGDSVYSRPAWSPDGRSVLYVASIAGKLYRKRADGTGKDSILADIGKHTWGEASYSRDGGWLILRSISAGSARDIYALRTNGDSVLRELVATPLDEFSPAVSPDGRWLAYVSMESGNPEVYVRPFPNTADGKYQISVNGASEPVWAHSGRELFFVNTANQLVAAEITTTPGFSVGKQQVLFPLGFFTRDQNHSAYAVAPDDRRFVMIQGIALASGDLVMVQNWLEVLKGKLKQ